MKKFMCRRFVAGIRDCMEAKKNREKWEKVRELDVFMNHKYRQPQHFDTYPPHPEFNNRYAECQENLQNFVNDKPWKNGDTVGYGDSILHGAQHELTSLDYRLNFSLWGMWHCHIEKMVTTIARDLTLARIYPKFIFMGTLGGNPMLQHEEMDGVKLSSIRCLNTTRQIYAAERTRIIVFGCPPVESAYPALHQKEFETVIQEWVVADNNAVFLPLEKYLEPRHVVLANNDLSLPIRELAADGVHLTHKGKVMLDELFHEAKRTDRKVVD